MTTLNGAAGSLANPLLRCATSLDEGTASRVRRSCATRARRMLLSASVCPLRPLRAQTAAPRVLLGPQCSSPSAQLFPLTRTAPGVNLQVRACGGSSAGPRIAGGVRTGPC